MEIKYKNRKLEKICTIVSEGKKYYHIEMVKKIHQRIGEIYAADTVDFLIQSKIGRCHALIGNRKGQYAMDLLQPYRLIFEEVDNTIKIVKVIDILDYH